MHILVLSDDEESGGANIAARRLTDAFAGAGHRITRIYQRGSADVANWETILIPSLLATHELSLIPRAASRLVPHSIRLRRHQRSAQQRLAEILTRVRPDVISVHNLHIASWSPSMIAECARVAPVVCTLHDTWTFTGRCVFPGECQKYVLGCDASCPTHTEYPRLAVKQIAGAWTSRRDILRDCSNTAAVAPSDWIGRIAAAGLWGPRKVFKIPLALDLRAFNIIPRAAAKSVMGLRPDDRVVLACASDLSSPRKGVLKIFEALRHGLRKDVHLILMGAPLDVPRVTGVTVHQLGFVRDDRLRALVFNTADVFIHAALADNAPLTVIESLACGTPLVAFPADGLPETVIADQTGWLVPDLSSASLRNTIAQALDELEGGLDLRSKCRQFAEARYDPSDIASQYERVFLHMIHGERISVPLVQPDSTNKIATDFGAAN